MDAYCGLYNYWTPKSIEIQFCPLHFKFVVNSTGANQGVAAVPTVTCIDLNTNVAFNELFEQYGMRGHSFKLHEADG